MDTNILQLTNDIVSDAVDLKMLALESEGLPPSSERGEKLKDLAVKSDDMRRKISIVVSTLQGANNTREISAMPVATGSKINQEDLEIASQQAIEDKY